MAELVSNSLANLAVSDNNSSSNSRTQPADISNGESHKPRLNVTVDEHTSEVRS